ncbi:MAG: HNH endonuclease [Thaumarchaeota archaeon]|nr:HNH endonuclease [Nitrososphaerota archaeon]MCL5317706.1 HNH endonuclease [Nitrososphaerota archaeon]
MPPAAVKTIRDLIFWQYSKIIAESAGLGKSNYGFIMDRFKKLQRGDISWSTSIREYVKEREERDRCIYCGAEGKLTLEHILPLSRNGPDDPDNAVMVCGKCNSNKGCKRLFEWFGLENRDGLPRIAEGKYLKLLYELHEHRGTISMKPQELCPKCDLGAKCPEKGALTVYCLEGVFLKK